MQPPIGFIRARQRPIALVAERCTSKRSDASLAALPSALRWHWLTTGREESRAKGRYSLLCACWQRAIHAVLL